MGQFLFGWIDFHINFQLENKMQRINALVNKRCDLIIRDEPVFLKLLARRRPDGQIRILPSKIHAYLI